jgi:16S rRNA G966 N2-methylase RsmD
VFDGWGYWNYYNNERAKIRDIERVFAVLDGNRPNFIDLESRIDESRRYTHGPRQSLVESDYFRIRTFKNGNAHLWFTRKDLVEKVNKLLAEYYGAVIPDAYPENYKPEDPKAGLPAKNLSFYPTPLPVIDAMYNILKHLYQMDKNSKILEPSAGTGSIVEYFLNKGYCNIDAIEIDPQRLLALRDLKKNSGVDSFNVYGGNFLTIPPRPEYDMVLMNPPFYGTHWMDHVMKAKEWLKPNGIIISVLPATAEFGESKQHAAFNKWLQEQHSHYFVDLPQESFVSVGTRISTVILKVQI